MVSKKVLLKFDQGRSMKTLTFIAEGKFCYGLLASARDSWQHDPSCIMIPEMVWPSMVTPKDVTKML
jgi:hypothetical protein